MIATKDIAICALLATVASGSAAVTQFESALTDAQGALAALILLWGNGL